MPYPSSNLGELALPDGHAHGGGDGRRRVPRPEAVVLRLRALGEPGQTPALPERVHPMSPPRQDLVGVHLEGIIAEGCGGAGGFVLDIIRGNMAIWYYPLITVLAFFVVPAF